MVVPVVLLLGTSLVQPIAAEQVPRINIEATCRAVPEDPDNQMAYQSCLKEEQDARTELERQWASFQPPFRRTCGEVAGQATHPSYVELLVCIQMYEQNAKDSTTTGSTRREHPGTGRISPK